MRPFKPLMPRAFIKTFFRLALFSMTSTKLLFRFFCFFTALVCLGLIHQTLFTPSIDLLASIESDDAAELQVYVNQSTAVQRSAYNSAGKKVYRFNDIGPKVDTIRLVIDKSRVSRVTIHGFEVRYSPYYLLDPSGLLFRIDQRDWKQWFYTGFTPSPDTPGLLTSVAGFNDVFLLPHKDFSLEMETRFQFPKFIIWLWLATGMLILLGFWRREVWPVKTRRHVFFLALAGLSLRLVGISWGTSGTSIPMIPFADEIFSVAVLQNIFRGELVTPGYREGNLIYFVWWFVLSVAHLGGFTEVLPSEINSYNSQYGNVILIGRCVNVLLDSVSIVLIYACIKKITGKHQPAFWGALLFAVLPFEIFFGRYMRTHIPGNFFLVLSLLLSLNAYGTSSAKKWARAGFTAGLALAVRYNLICALVIPVFYLLAGKTEKHREILTNIWKMRWLLLVVLASYGLAFVLVDSGFVLESEHVAHELSTMQKYVSAYEFQGWHLFDITKLLKFFIFLIPLAMYPLLWVPVYLLAPISLSGKKYHLYLVPLFIFCFVYLYSMSKGYPFGFLRPTIGVYPLFAVIVGVGIDVLTEYRLSRTMKKCLGYSFGVACALSAIYAALYSFELTRPSTREELFVYLNQLRTGTQKLEVALVEEGMWFDSSYGVVAIHDGFHHTTLPRTADFNASGVDCLVLGWISPLGDDIDSVAAQLQSTTRYKNAKVIERNISLFGYSLLDRNDPFDLNYQFPRFIVLSAAPLPS